MILYRISILEKGGTFIYGDIKRQTFTKIIREATYCTDTKQYRLLVEQYPNGEGSITHIYEDDGQNTNSKDINDYYINLYKTYDDIVQIDIQRQLLKTGCYLILFVAICCVLYQAIRPNGSPIIASIMGIIAWIAFILRIIIDRTR